MPRISKAEEPRHANPALSSSDIDVLLRESNSAAGRLVRQFRLPADHRDDFRQDLLVDLLRRVTTFNPGRGTLGAFAGTLARHQSGRIVRRIRREQPVFVQATKPSAFSSSIDFEGGDAGNVDPPDNDYLLHERRIDLKRALGELPPDDVRLCRDLIELTPTEICQHGARSRASVYRAIKRIRAHMIRRGVSAAM